MIDIAELLKARKSEFISLRELITRISLHQPHVSIKDIADFLYIENSNAGLPEWVKKGIAGSIEATYVDDTVAYDTDYSIQSLLKVIHETGDMPQVRLLASPAAPLVLSEPPMDFDDDIPF
ncbi:hypothetical protein [Cronobacter muytjensii]|uniref:hypothetical protein n=1 Tax=Cronobacter muytjensii TaxID=413501 RepID=UPI0015881D60|nr:hypothetical protein [Cronobacter muytjensii]NUW60145.1 hypothetical protein [Cronobacter muytjensii]